MTLASAIILLGSSARAAHTRIVLSALPCSTRGIAPYLHTCGPYIENVLGQPVRLRGVNWYGFESNDFVPAGLDRRPYRAILATIKRLGFNTVRLPFSNEMLEHNPVVSALTSTCPQDEPATACRVIHGRTLLAANSDLWGLSALQILKVIVDEAGRQGLYVIVDDHRSRAGWGPQENGLWYDSKHGYPMAAWLRDRQRLVRVFDGDPALTGVDLFNEPHSLTMPANCTAYLMSGASWGACDGRSRPQTDWRAAAEVAGNAVLALNAHLLIVVEGVSVTPRGGKSPRSLRPGANPIR